MGRVLLWVLLVTAFVLHACGRAGAPSGDADADTDADADSDVIGDGDADSDADADPDADGESDGDGDADTGADTFPDSDELTDSDIPTDGDADSAPPECVCPQVFPSSCEDLDRVAFGGWDDSLLTQLLQAIACAETSLDIAVYDVTWSCVVDAILSQAATHPGLSIRIVTEEENCERPGADLTCELSRLEDAGLVDVVLDNRSYLMHHKVTIVDGQMALVASANWTEQSLCGEWNNAVMIEEAGIVSALQDEFDRLHGEDFGNAPWTQPIEAGAVRLFMSPPGDAWQEALVEAIDGTEAGGTIHFLVFAFTQRSIAEALVAAHDRGVTVAGAVGSRFASEDAVEAMTTAGIDVRSGPVHHKSLFIEDASGATTLIVGSGNFSANALRNNESVVFIADDDELFDAFEDELAQVFADLEAEE